MPAHAEILKSKSKKNPFRVKLIGENGEILMTSETLTTRNNCKKNLRAVLGVMRVGSITTSFIVHDFTDKNFVPFRKFRLYADGLEEAC